MINNISQNLNNYYVIYYTNVLDSALVAFTTLCDPIVQNYDSGHPRPQTNLNFPESRTLVSLGVFRVGGIFF